MFNGVKFVGFFFHVQLNLRHNINNEILIYPGYIPQPGVKYRVFHYGLEFKVGNWSFDKANWRDTDVVHKCWSKFPDPPDPSSLDQTDEDSLQRDLLSIECAKTLNEALRLHHERMCSNPNSLSTSNSKSSNEVKLSRKFGKIDETHTIQNNNVPMNESREYQVDDNQMLGSFRIWIISLWAFSIFGFAAIMWILFASRKGQRKRGKSYKSKRRALHTGFGDMNELHKQMRGVDIL